MAQRVVALDSLAARTAGMTRGSFKFSEIVSRRSASRPAVRRAAHFAIVQLPSYGPNKMRFSSGARVGDLVRGAAGGKASMETARGAACVAHASASDSIYRVMSANQEISVISVVGTGMVADAPRRGSAEPGAVSAAKKWCVSCMASEW